MDREEQNTSWEAVWRKKNDNSLSQLRVLPRESSPIEMDANNKLSISAASETGSVEFIGADIPGATLDRPKTHPEWLMNILCSFALVAPVSLESSFYIRRKSNS